MKVALNTINQPTPYKSNTTQLRQVSPDIMKLHIKWNKNEKDYSKEKDYCNWLYLIDW